MASIDELRFCAKYPFSAAGRKRIEEMKLDLPGVSTELLEAAAGRVRGGLPPAAALREINGAKEGYLVNTMLTFPLAKILAALSENRLVLQQFGRLEARRVSHFLQDEKEDEAVVFGLAKELLGAERAKAGYSLPLMKYLEYVPEGKEWALVNQEVEAGGVFTDRYGLAALIGRYVSEGVLRTKVDKKAVPKMFLFFADELKKEKKSLLEGLDLGVVEAELFPPCMRKIIAQLASGEKVGHIPRFVLSTFAAGTNMPIEEALALFRNQPNFNEKKTRYYLEHSYGTKGMGTKYSVPSCTKMETYGLCERDATCQWRHPLVYYAKRKERRRQK